MKFETLKRIFRLESLRHHSVGFCPVCNRRSVFLIIDRLDGICNHALCIWCKSCSRNRHVAVNILSHFAHRGISALSDFKNHPEIAVLNTSASSAIARALGKGESIHHSEYFEDVPSGSYKNGVRSENLERLSFPDESIDLVISEDVFEHVQDIEKGFAQVARVLKKGGYHIFSIPFFFDRRTEHLFEKRGDEYVPTHFPIEYHGDFIRDRIPAYHHIGYDLFENLEKIGLDTRVARSPYDETKKYGTFNGVTFISKKM
jgi:SAM-dependent methyltransferase